MNLMILLLLILERFIKATDMYLLEFSQDTKSPITNMRDFLIITEALNSILSQCMLYHEMLIKACVKITDFNADEAKNKDIIISNINIFLIILTINIILMVFI